MMDFHTHILPGIDDGSRDLEMSIAMLKLLKESGVSTVVATPHFYADRQNPESFLRHRKEALGLLCPEAEKLGMKLIPGAEVLYFSGVSHIECLSDFRIGETNMILIEMPYEWQEHAVREIEDMACRYTVVMAHIDRYMTRENIKMMERLMERDILMQMNYSAFTERSTRKKALKLFQSGMVQFLGTDCHNVTDRKPNVTEGREFLLKYMSENRLATFIHPDL